MTTRTIIIAVVPLAFFSLAPLALAQGGSGDVGWRCPDEPKGAPLYRSANSCTNSPCLSTCVLVDNTSSGTNNSGSRPSQGVNNGVNNTVLLNPLGSGTNSLLDFLNKILDFVIYLGGLVVTLMLIYVGFLFVVARGNDTKLTAARQAFQWTVIGALILLGSKAIAAGIMATIQALGNG